MSYVIWLDTFNSKRNYLAGGRFVERLHDERVERFPSKDKAEKKLHEFTGAGGAYPPTGMGLEEVS